jgi:type II secretory pathway component PulF
MLDGIRLALSFGPNRRAEFYELLADYVSDGTDIVSATDDVHRMYVGMKDGRQRITADILFGYRGGASSGTAPFGTTLAKYVPPVEAIALDAADSAGETKRGLEIAADSARVAAEVQRTIWSLMIAPVLLTAAAIGVLIFLRTGLIPAMSEVLPRAKWPVGPALLGKISDFVPLGVPVLLTCLLAYFIFFGISKNRWTGPSRNFFDHWIFPFNVYRQVAVSGILSSLSVMVRSGIPFSNAVERLRDSSPKWHRVHMSAVVMRLRDGVSDGDALAPLYDGEAKFRIAAYGRRSTFHSAMAKISAQLNKLLIAALTVRFGLIKIGAMTAVAVLIGLSLTSFIAISMALRSSGGF